MNKKENVEYTFNRIRHILSEIPFFEEFSGDELDFFSRNLSLRSFPKKTTLFRKGDIGDYLFFIADGVVEVRLEATGSSKTKLIAILGQGSCVGEMSIMDDYPRSATIVVRGPSELLVLTKNRFESICKENAPVGIKFLKGITKNLSLRLRKTTGKFFDLG
jgi:CRP-like cAMP-binding protein